MLRLQLALKDSEQRALLPSSPPQNTQETETRIAALEKEIEELKKRVRELEELR